MFSWLAHFIERHPFLHRTSLAVWKHFPPRLAGFLRNLLTTRWAVGAVAVIIDEAVNPPEVLLVQHSYRTKGAWGLPGGSLESGLRNPLEPSKEESREESRDDIIESSLRREVFEELGIEIEIVRLTKIDAVPYVPEEPGPYRLDFYYRCLPKQGFSSLREGLGTGIIKPRSPEVRQILLVPRDRGSARLGAGCADERGMVGHPPAGLAANAAALLGNRVSGRRGSLPGALPQ